MKSKGTIKMKFVIFAPKGLKTGGPEGMHQLAWALDSLGQEARLLAWPGSKRKISVNEYEKYGAKWCRVSEINHKDIFIVSEGIGFLPFWYFLFISKQRIYMWMHSIDFSLDKDLNQYERKNYTMNSDWATSNTKKSKIKIVLRRIGFLRIYHKFKYLFNLLKKIAFKGRIKISPSNYLFASYYSQHTIAKVKNSRSDILLSGWVNGVDIENLEDMEFCQCTKNHVAFNPGKSKELVSKLIEINVLQNSVIHFMPIAGIKTDKEVYKLLASCDLYLDLGFFPGLERTPREAIRMNCPVLLARRGAARFYQDFPVSTDYLLDLSLLGPTQTYEVILKVLAYGKEYNLKNQKVFKDFVGSEKNTFLIEVKRFIHLIENITS